MVHGYSRRSIFISNFKSISEHIWAAVKLCTEHLLSRLTVDTKIGTCDLCLNVDSLCNRQRLSGRKTTIQET